MAIIKVELMHECFQKHSRMGTAKMKLEKETEKGKKRGVSIERIKGARKNKISPDGVNNSSPTAAFPSPGDAAQ